MPCLQIIVAPIGKVLEAVNKGANMRTVYCSVTHSGAWSMDMRASCQRPGFFFCVPNLSANPTMSTGLRLGNRVSIIAFDNMRYEGTVTEVDPEKHTVKLETGTTL